MTQFAEINNELIIKYLRNELNETEKLIVVSWLEADKQNLEFLIGLKEAYTVSKWSNVMEDADVDAEWIKLHGKIILESKKQSISPKKLVIIFSKYAAILILAFALGFGFNQYYANSKLIATTIETGSGRSSVVYLADGSKVTLNAKSTLTYNTHISNAREVTLHGEAVFDIKKDNGKPFFVNTSNCKIKVLGTIFNVSAYDNDNYISTTLKQGKVQILESSSGKQLSELKEGERFYMDKKSGNYTVQLQQDLNNDFGWYDGKLCFNDISLKELCNKLEREFGYSFEIKNNNFQTFRYKAYVERESIDNILKYIEFVTPDVHYNIDRNEKKVVLY